MYWEPGIWGRLQNNISTILKIVACGQETDFSPVNGWSKSQPLWQRLKASRRQAQNSLHHLSFYSPASCLQLLGVHWAPEKWLSECYIFFLYQNKDLRDISCLLGCCAIAEVGGGHRNFLFLHIVLSWRANIHGAGIGSMSVRLAGSLNVWGRASVTGAGRVVAGWGVIGEGTAHLLVEVLRRFDLCFHNNWWLGWNFTWTLLSPSKDSSSE